MSLRQLSQYFDNPGEARTLLSNATVSRKNSAFIVRFSDGSTMSVPIDDRRLIGSLSSRILLQCLAQLDDSILEDHIDGAQQSADIIHFEGMFQDPIRDILDKCVKLDDKGEELVFTCENGEKIKFSHLINVAESLLRDFTGSENGQTLFLPTSFLLDIAENGIFDAKEIVQDRRSVFQRGVVDLDYIERRMC